MYRLLITLLCCIPLLASAKVYKWVDDQGVVHYTDTPHQGAEEIKLHKETAPATPPQRTGKSSRESSGNKGIISGNYDTFTIAEPENNQTVRSNQGLVSISFFIEPALQSGHKIRLFVDGRRLKNELTSTHFSLKGINRGTHSLRAEVIGEDGEPTASTDSITFHLRKHSIIKPMETDKKDDDNIKNTPSTSTTL